MKSDFSRWAVAAPKDTSGIGREARDVRAVLGVGHQFVCQSMNFVTEPAAGPREISLPADLTQDELRQRLTAIPGLQGILFFERTEWHPELVPTCRALGLKTVGVVHWEWFNPANPQWKLCDLLVAPCAFAERILRPLGFPTVVLPWPLDLTALPPRQIRGPARRFVHNAGFVDLQDRKGTADTMVAFARADLPVETSLLVRLQKSAIELPPGNARTEIRTGTVPTSAGLYAEGEVIVQPSKMEGVGFQVLEAVASGLPVLTLNHAPMNEWVQRPEMLVRPRWFKRRAFPTAWIPHAFLRLPDRRDLARKMEWCATHDLSEVSAQNRWWAEKTFAPDRVRAVWSEAISRILP